MKERVFSGIRATGRLHLGNYLGAIKGMLALQETHECVFGVMDLHALTTPLDYSNVANDVKNVVLDYLAAGLDPGKAILTVQSHNAGHLELSWILGDFTPVAWLEHLPTYKDKKAQHPDFVNLGLLSYPVLMAADILVYKAQLVPVGLDQEPHIEFAREVARKFNRQFDYNFPEPKRFEVPGAYVPSIAGNAGKMGKSIEGSYINLSDDLETIQKRLAKAPTDAGNETEWSQGTKNLFSLMDLFSPPEVVAEFKEARTKGAIRYGEMKKRLAEDIFAELGPLQEHRRELEAKPGYVEEVLADGAERARKLAEPTLNEVKKLVGLG